MINWDDARFFLALARQGTLRGAAGVLGVDQATVGRRITALEQANATLAAERLALVKENAELKRILDQSETGRRVQGQSPPGRDGPRGRLRMELLG